MNFLQQLQDEIQETETDSLNESLWTASNFNAALEQTDNIAGLPHHGRVVTTLKELLTNLDIHDIWSTNHPPKKKKKKKEYTWSKPTLFTARRMDLKKLWHNIRTTNLSKLQHEERSRILDVQLFITVRSWFCGRHNFIDAHLSEHQNDNPEMTWEKLKVKILILQTEYTNTQSKNREHQKHYYKNYMNQRTTWQQNPRLENCKEKHLN